MKTYELIDSGQGEKLERFGDFVLRRPDPQALYPKKLSDGEWSKADAIFEQISGKGKWLKKKEIPENWQVTFDDLVFSATLGTFKHVGIFPEHEQNWKWLKDTLKTAASLEQKPKVLNLFGYTGGATLACAAAGAEVTHLDASKGVVDVARKNAELSGLKDAPIRWIVDDAKKFVAREIKRGARYDGIIMDPPSYGHGIKKKKDIWDIEDDLMPLIEDCKQLLSSEPIFFLINGYSAGYSSLAYANNLLFLEKKGGKVESGELSIEESSSGRRLPAGIFARWRKA